MKQKTQERLIALALFVFLIISLIPLLLIARYNFLSMDDYTYSNIVRDSIYEGQSFFGILWAQACNAYECFSTWQGQYFVNWVIMVFLALGGAAHYDLVVMITLIPMLIADLFLAYMVLGKGLKASFSQVCIAIIPVMILQLSFPPSAAEAFYWLCGAVTYTTTYAISLVSLGLLVNLLYAKQNSKVQNTISAIVLLVFSFCLGGSNFVTGLFMLLVFFLFAVYGVWVKHKHRIIYVANLVVFTVCFLLTAFSPGATNRRLENADAQVPAVKAILLSLYEAAKYITTWTFPFVIIAVLAMIPIFWRIVKKTSYRYPLPLLVLLFSFGMYAAQFTPNQYALGIVGAYRVQNIYRFQMFFWLLGNEFYLLGWIHARFPEWKMPLAVSLYEKIKRIPLVSFVYCFVMGCLVFGTMYVQLGPATSSYSAFKSLREGNAAIYYEEHQERLKLLEDDTIEDVVLEPFSCPPYTLFFEDWKSSNSWENADAAKYFGKNSIIVKEAE